MVLETHVEKKASRVLQTHNTQCHTLSPSADGTTCLAGTNSGTVWRSDPREGLSRKALDVLDRHKLPVGVYQMQRCPQDENLLGVVGHSPLLRLYDLRKAKGGPVSTFAPQHLREQTALSISGMDWSSAGTHIVLNYLEECMYEVCVTGQREVLGRADAGYRPQLPPPPTGSLCRSRGGARRRIKAASSAVPTSARSVSPSTSVCAGTCFRQEQGCVVKRSLQVRDVRYSKPQGRSLRSAATARKKASLPPCFGWVRRDLPAPPEPPYRKRDRAQAPSTCKCDWPDCPSQRAVTCAPDEMDGSYVRCFQGRTNVNTVKGIKYMGQRDCFVVSGSDDGMVVVVERSSGKPVNAMLACRTGPANCLAPHPSRAMLLAVGGLDSAVAVFQAVGEPAYNGRHVDRNAEVALSHAGAVVRRREAGLSQGRLGAASGWAGHSGSMGHYDSEDESDYDMGVMSMGMHGGMHSSDEEDDYGELEGDEDEEPSFEQMERWFQQIERRNHRRRVEQGLAFSDDSDYGEDSGDDEDDGNSDGDEDSDGWVDDRGGPPAGPAAAVHLPRYASGGLADMYQHLAALVRTLDPDAHLPSDLPGATSTTGGRQHGESDEEEGD